MKRVTPIVFFCVLSAIVFGQEKPSIVVEAGTNPVISNEISNQFVSSFAEDAFGQIWISTNRGLNKLNINKYHQYFSTDDSTSIADNRIHHVYKDSKDILWVATTNGVCRYNEQDCFDQVSIESVSANALFFFENKDGQLFLSMNFEILAFNEKTDRFEPVIRNLNPINFTTSCHVDYLNNIWVVTPFEVRCYSSHTYELKKNLQREKYTTFSHIDDNGRLWLASWGNMEVYDTHTDRYVEVPPVIARHPVLSKAIIYKMYPYTNSSYLILTQKDGMFLYNKLTETVIHQSESGFPFEVPGFEITSLFTDSRKNLWVGSYDQGYKVIYSYKERFNSNHFLQSKLDGLSVTSVANDQDNNLWAVTRSEGIMLYRNDNYEIQNFPNTELYSFWSGFQHKAKKIYIDSRNDIWILSDWMLLRTRFENNKIDVKKWHYFPAGIMSITEDEKGTIWLGGANQIYHLKKGETEFSEFHLYGKEYTFTPTIITLSSGNVLVASFNQELQFIDAETYEVSAIKIKHLIKKSLFVPVFLFEDAVGDIWIGTINNGLYRLYMNDKTILPVEGISCPDISSITEDISGNIWVGTLFGLSKFDRTTQRFINYYATDGIGGNQFNEQSVCRLADNTLVFGGTHGLTIFNPIDINYKQNIPLLFENLKIHNKIVHPATSKNIDKHLTYNPDITLKHHQNSFAISFSAIDYSEFERIEYAYQLEGFDDMWIEANSSHEAYYSNVPAGRYTFRVRIYNKENTIQETQNEIRVRIKPAPWLSWPAYVLYSLIFILLVFLGIRLQRKIRTNREKALQAEREKEQEHKVNMMNMSFFANLSHEFRTPLTMISGPVATLCNDNEIKEESKQLIYIVQRSVNRMLRLVNQLMDFNKLENDTLKLRVKLTDIIAELKRPIEIFRLNAKGKGIDIKTFGLEDNFITWLDADKFDKILANLLSNALKFCDSNGKIGVSFDVITRDDALEIFPLAAGDTSTQWIKIAVSDTGKGIPEDKLEKVFERYFQLDNHTKDNYNWGTGIGLYYTRRLVELHHGNIKATNREAGGAKFIFILPVSEMAYSPEERKPEPDEQQTQDLTTPLESESLVASNPDKKNGKQKLLIIDDDIDIVNYLNALLSPHFDVTYKFDADSALKALKEIEPDLILCDVVMPRTDGYTFSRQVKDSLSFSHIPIILVTAKATVENQVEGLNSGADAYVTKPFDPNYLLALINSQLSNRRKIQSMLVGATKTERIERDALTPQDNAFMSELYKLMETELSNPELNIIRMTEVLNMSRTKFYYKVKGLTGENPAILFKTYKLNRAAELLLEGNMNISEIADMTGFSNPSHFSVSFKKQFGVSPKNYHG
jgi:signal transduction histidine kinase/ligand-binding sensor domain-containing protein/DNA-binding response OmpR family regulator